MLTRVISGGQTGADIAALKAAKSLGIPTGGYIPKGWLTETGPAPWLGVDFRLVETESRLYPVRTKLNVRAAAGTLWVGDPTSRGGKLTWDFCRQFKKPFTACDPDRVPPADAANLLAWLAGTTGVLNCAGNRESLAPGLEAKAQPWFREVFRLLRAAPVPGPRGRVPGYGQKQETAG